MVDSSQIDAFDDWVFDLNETVNYGDNHPSPAISTNESSLPIIQTSSLVNKEEENNIKKRKNEQK
ncbi:unnamed protein product, partial [Rotaria socialis]